MTTLSAKGDVDGSTPSHTQGMFKTGVGKMWQAFVDLFGTDSGAMRTVHETAKFNGPGILQNLKLTPTVGSNALTMTVQTRAGAVPSAADPVLVSVRNATATAGDSLLRQVSATLALVISSGSTLGHSSGAAGTIYWYLVDSDGAGTMKLAASSTYYGPSFIGTTVAEGGAGAADSATVIYSDAIYSNKAMRLIGKTIDTQTTAGTWTALPSQVDLWPFDAPATSVATPVCAAVRQTVSGGPTDSNGLPNLSGSTGSTTVTTSNISSTAPLAVAAAYGFDNTNGKALDYFGFSTSNLSWTGLSTNGTMFLYVDVNTTTGALTTGSTTLAPTYQWGGTYSTTNNQHTYNIQDGQMRVGNGSTASQVARVFVGQVTVSGGVVTAITWYAYSGRYQSPFTSTLPSGSTNTTLNHNLGVYPGTAEVELECTSAEYGFAVGDRLKTHHTNNGASVPVAFSYTATAMTFTTGNTNAWVTTNRSTYSNQALTLANWKYRATAYRGW